MKNKKGIIIIYLEGDSGTASMQEKNFFEIAESRRIWDFSLKKLGYNESLIYRSQKIMKLEGDWNQLTNTLNGRVKKIFNKNSNLLILITGDHDEISNVKTLEHTEDIANYIKNKYIKSKNIDCKIVLDRDRTFKIESLMSEFVDCHINKKILKQKTGTTYPSLIKLFSVFHNINDEGKIKLLFYKKIIKSNHKLLCAIKDNSPTHTNK